MDESLFEGKVITDIELPIGSAAKGSTMKISVVKLKGGVISETKETITLTSDKAYTNEWVMFSNLSIEVPEGYTLAFGSSSDTIRLRFCAKIPGYEFYDNRGGVNAGACLAFNVYGKENTALTAKPVAEGAVNLLPKDMERAYPLSSAVYNQWDYNGAPYTFLEQDYFGGKTITDIEVPIFSSPAGGKLTITVAKMNGTKVVESLQSYTLTCEAAVNREWVFFHGLSIEVPEGYTLVFGAQNDSAKFGFVNMPINGYGFSNKNGDTSTVAAIVFNVYGK